MSIKQKFSQAGFGVLEVMILVSMVGAMAYFVMDQRAKASKFQQRSEFDLEVENAATLIRQFLADTYTCSATVDGYPLGTIIGAPIPPVPGELIKGQVQNGALPFISEGLWNPSFPATPNSTIYNRGRVLLRSGDAIKAGFQISAINVFFNGIEDVIRVRFGFVDSKAGASGILKEINRDFKLITKKITTATGDYITECFLNISEDDLIRGCTKLQGDWDSNTKKCIMRDYFLRSKDLVNVYDNGAGGFTTNAIVRSTTSCTCPMSSCNFMPAPTCCRPPLCPGTYFNENPARLVKAAMSCKTEVNCYDRPIGHLIKGP